MAMFITAIPLFIPYTFAFLGVKISLALLIFQKISILACLFFLSDRALRKPLYFVSNRLRTLGSVLLCLHGKKQVNAVRLVQLRTWFVMGTLSRRKSNSEKPSLARNKRSCLVKVLRAGSRIRKLRLWKLAM